MDQLQEARLGAALHQLAAERVARRRPGQGLPSASVDAAIRLTRITQSDLARALGIPERTLVRRKREGTLSPEESAKLVRFARVVERAETVFEDADAALGWLQSPCAALGGVRPLSLLDTEIGADSVLDTLGRIEHGVFAWCASCGASPPHALRLPPSMAKARGCMADAGIRKAGR